MHCETTVDPEGTWVGSWYALEKAYAEGSVNAIGVSNFDFQLLDTFLDSGYFGNLPHVVQNFAEPGQMDRDVLDWCTENHVAFQVIKPTMHVVLLFVDSFSVS
jgi:diketogulonate reductase-like aldo/keto reductase